MKFPIIAQIIALFMLFHSCQAKPPRKGGSHVVLSNDGAWCWFSDPRAVYFNGKYERVYAGWVSADGDICVGYYDLGTKRKEYTIIHENFEKDDHNNPVLHINNNGYIKVFYSKHASTEPIYMQESISPEDIMRWKPIAALPLNDTSAYKGYRNSYTYVNICQLSCENNKMFLFWRGMDFKPNYSVSIDNGKTWSSGKILILPERVYSQRRPYVKISTNNNDKIHLAFTDGHPRKEPTNSIYYMYYKNNKLYKANGEPIMGLEAAPVSPSQTDMVYDAAKTKEKAWIWDVAEDKKGMPVLVYSRFPDDSNHIYSYARFNGLEWENYDIVNSGKWFPHTPIGKKEPEPNYSGGISLDHENPSIVYLSQEINGIFEIGKWVTSDNGKNWKTYPITTNSKFDNVRPYAILNSKNTCELQVLWMHIPEYLHYTNYKSSIITNLPKN